MYTMLYINNEVIGTLIEKENHNLVPGKLVSGKSFGIS